MNKRRVVVTGLGLVTPLGNDVASTWDGLANGRSGIRNITNFDTTDFPTKFAGTIADFDTTLYMNKKEARKNDLFVQYGYAAGMQAFHQANLTVDESRANRYGFAIGSGIGGLGAIETNSHILRDNSPRKISPFFIPSALINMISGNLSIELKMRGPNLSLVSACTTGTHNIIQGARSIQYGDADVMLAGGSEWASVPVGMAGFSAARALSTRNDAPTEASRPWDKERDGFVLSDGAGVVVLESLEHAQARGANILAEVIGCGMSADAYHKTLPSGLGALESMQMAVKDAEICPSSIDYINAHATSTVAGDLVEAKACAELLGGNVSNVAMSGTKSMTGHLLGAAGAVEAIFCILAIQNKLIPPTINLDDPDNEFGFNLVPNTAQEKEVNIALSNSFGFGGTNGSLIFKSFKG